VRKGETETVEHFNAWRKDNSRILDNIGRTFETLPNLNKWGMETWEWTVHREFFDHLNDCTSYYLDRVLGDVGETLRPQEKVRRGGAMGDEERSDELKVAIEASTEEFFLNSLVGMLCRFVPSFGS